MAGQPLRHLVGFRIAQTHAEFRCRAGQPVSLRAESQPLHLALSAQTHASEFVAVDYFPDAQGPGPVHSSNLGSARAYGQRQDALAGPLDLLLTSTGCDVPESQPVIAVAPAN